MQETTILKLYHKVLSVSPKTKKKVLINIVFIGVYILMGRFGLSFASLNSSASAIWPPTGIAIAAIILFGYEMWPGIFLGALITNILTSGSIPTSLIISIGNTTEAILGGYFVNRFTGGRSVFNEVKNTTAFVLLAGLLAPMISATIGVSSLLVAGFAQYYLFSRIWVTWWLGDVAGTLLLVPFIILWVNYSKIKFSVRYFFELTLVFCALVITTQIAFGDFITFLPPNYPITFIIIPPLLWAAVRFSKRETATLMLLTAIFSIRGILKGYGAFVTDNPNESLALIQSWLIVTAISVLLLSITMSDKRVSERSLASREKYFRSLIEKNYDAITVIDEKAKIIYTSPSTEKIFGYSIPELVGQSGIAYLHPEDQIKAREALTELLKSTGNVLRAETRIQHKNGNWLHVESVVTNMLNDESVGAIVVNYRDITERKEIEEKKNQFISFIYQQLRIPLGTIERYTNSLSLKKENLSSIERGYVKEIGNANQDMVSMVENLIKMSRISLGTLNIDQKSIDVERVVEDSLKNTKQRITSKEIKIQRSFKIPNTNIQNDLSLFSSLINTVLIQAIGRTNVRSTLSIELTKKGGRIWLKFIPNTLKKDSPKETIVSKKLNTELRSEQRNREEAEFFVAKALASYIGIEIIDHTKRKERSIILVI